jgi:outer membrane protein
MKNTLAAAVSVCLLASAQTALSYEPGDWILRAGVVTVAPNSSSDDIALPTGLVAEARVDDDTQLSIIPAYMVDANWGVELLTATPFEHNIEARGKGAIAGVSLDAGSTKHLPPTFMVQWYPRGDVDGWQPYVGFGLNYTLFFDEDVDGELVDLLGDLTGGAVDGADLDLDPSWGLAAQVGVDIPVADQWSINLGVWYIDIDTEAKITATSAGAEVTTVKFDVDIDPWVYNIGVAYRF